MFGPVFFLIIAVSYLVCFLVKFRFGKNCLNCIEDEKKRKSAKYIVYTMPVFSIIATIIGSMLLLGKDFDGAFTILLGAAMLSVGGTSVLEKIIRDYSK